MNRKTLPFVFLLLLLTLVPGEVVSFAATYQDNDNLESYLTMITDGEHSADLYANIGYAYFQRGEIANAILYYEKAAKLDPHDHKIHASLNQIRSELPIQITHIPDFILVRWYRNAYNCLSSTMWSIMQVLAGLLLLYFVYRLLFHQIKTRPLYQWITITGLLVTILISGFFAYHRKQFEIGGNSGISMIQQELYEAPDARSGSVVSIGPGNKVFIIDNIGEWYKVQLRDKDTGWILKENIALI